MKNTILIILGIIVLILVGILVYQFYAPSLDNNQNANTVQEVDSFRDCVAAGNPVMESYPRQCRVGNEVFTEDIGNELEKKDLIRIDNPRPNAKITSPLQISGEARGTWFFEANFPVVLLDNEGNKIVEHYATAEEDWMTEDFVPFKSTLEFESPGAGESGTLILKKANPSGLPENDDELIVPMIFR